MTSSAGLTVVAPSLRAGNTAQTLAPHLQRFQTGKVAADRLHLLFSLFGFEQDANQELPAGAVSYLGDTGIRPEGYWLRADPVHLRATLRDVFLEPPGRLGLVRDEADRLARDIGQHFQDRGWRLMVVTPERWYLNAPTARLRTLPTQEMAGRNVNGFLPAGDDAGSWRAHWNELQMLLHAHPVNQQRESLGRLTVNSLWFWGGGKLPEPAAAPWRKVWSDDPLVAGLASLSGIPVSPLPADPSGIGVGLQDGEEYLAVLPDDGDAADRAHPLIPWLTFLSGLSMHVTLLAPGEPEMTLSAPATTWGRVVDRFSRYLRA